MHVFVVQLKWHVEKYIEIVLKCLLWLLLLAIANIRDASLSVLLLNLFQLRTK